MMSEMTTPGQTRVHRLRNGIAGGKRRRRVVTVLILTSLASAVLTTGCSNSATTRVASEASAMGDTLPLPRRLAFMTGHVKAGLALYRAGDPAAAAPHLLHPVSETHAAEREGLDALGLDSGLFEAVSAALEAGHPATEIEPLLVAAEANLAMLADRAGGDATDIIRYLMATLGKEYAIGVQDGRVTDPGEYQDAFGFATVALERARATTPVDRRLIAELQALVALWPDGPIPPPAPTSPAQVDAQVERVLKAL